MKPIYYSSPKLRLCEIHPKGGVLLCNSNSYTFSTEGYTKETEEDF